jgi:hypothetical protein
MKFPKFLVTNFGNRNFMPMGRVSMHSKCLDFFFQVLGGCGGGFFSFFLCSHHVLIKFPLGSQCVPQECFMSVKFCPCINLCEKWWQTILKREISWANGKAQHTVMNNSICFSLGWGRGRGERYFLFFSLVLEVFPSCSHQILKVFPDAFPTLFPIAPGFCAI